LVEELQQVRLKKAMMNYAIESFLSAVIILAVCLTNYFLSKPYIEKKDEAVKKRWGLISRIILVIGCISSVCLIILGILFVIKL